MADWHGSYQPERAPGRLTLGESRQAADWAQISSRHRSVACLGKRIMSLAPCCYISVTYYLNAERMRGGAIASQGGAAELLGATWSPAIAGPGVGR